MTLKYVKLRLAVSCLAMLLLLAVMAIGAAGLAALSTYHDSTMQMLRQEEQSTASVMLINAIQMDAKKQVQDWKDLLLRGNNPDDYDHYLAAFLAEETRTQQELRLLRRQWLNTQRNTGALDAIILQQKVLHNEYRQALTNYHRHDMHDAVTVDAQMREIDRPFSQRLEGLADTERLRAALLRQDDAMAAPLQFHKTYLQMLTVTVLTVALGLALVIWLITRINHAVRRLSLTAEHYAEGDFSNSADTIEENELTIVHDAMKKMAQAVEASESELKGNIIELKHQATHDALTGLPNRMLLEDRISQSVASAARRCGRVIVIFLDLDNFKLINDSLGHDIGDVLLRVLADRLADCVRGSDTVARLGGDEFVILLDEEIQDGDLIGLVQRLIERVSQPVFLVDEERFVTCSIGISMFPQDGSCPVTLLKNADTAMYQAKALGRNCFQYFTREMNERLNWRFKLEADMRHALANEEFELYYQPQLELRSGRIIGCEALIRWNHPERGLISPAQFIPIAEESQIILQIGEWVLESACRQIQAWKEMGIVAPPVAINLSARQFDQQNVPEIIEHCLAAFGIGTHMLELEITEGMSMQHPEKTIDFVHSLKALGVSVAIDDFGTGYSNLSYLKNFPIDKLKLDKSFVCGITSNPEHLGICAAIIEMAHSLHLKVIAEGVEREGQLSVLMARGCDHAQGFLFSHPLTASAYTALLRSAHTLMRKGQGTHQDDLPTLLLVDDEPQVLSALSRTLSSQPYQILLAQNADDAFELLANHPVDVILTDHLMPGMNGLEFLSRVQKMYPHIVRTMLSAADDHHILISAINAGTIYKYLCKPWDNHQLLNTMNEAFQQATSLAT